MAERLTRPLLFFGIKHCGKSTLGRLTAEHFGVKFIDTDLELESRFQMLNGCPLPTRDIFRELGDPALLAKLPRSGKESMTTLSSKGMLSPTYWLKNGNDFLK